MPHFSRPILPRLWSAMATLRGLTSAKPASRPYPDLQLPPQVPLITPPPPPSSFPSAPSAPPQAPVLEWTHLGAVSVPNASNQALNQAEQVKARELVARHSTKSHNAPYVAVPTSPEVAVHVAGDEKAEAAMKPFFISLDDMSTRLSRMEEAHVARRSVYEDLRRSNEDLWRSNDDLRRGSEDLWRSNEDLRRGKESLAQQLEVLTERHNTVTRYVLDLNKLLPTEMARVILGHICEWPAQVSIREDGTSFFKKGALMANLDNVSAVLQGDGVKSGGEVLENTKKSRSRYG